MSQLFDLFHPGGTAPSPALHHLGWPWLGAPLLRCLKVQLSAIDVGLALLLPIQLTTIEVGPGLGFFFSSLPPSFPFLPPPWPPRPLESKVIPIQSDHLLATSPPVAAMERSKVTCSIQVC